MFFILTTIQYLNILISCVAISVGIRYSKSLKENKILLIIPISSLLQIVFSEVLKIINRNHLDVLDQSIILTNIYICLEFYLIILFFWKITESKLESILILVSTLIATIALFIFQKFEFKINLISIDLFLIIEGPIILTLTLFYLVKSMKIKNVINCIQEPNYIAALGIFLSFLVLWPVNILQNYFLKDTSTFFNFFFIANSTSYLIFFSFLTYSFYGTRK